MLFTGPLLLASPVLPWKDCWGVVHGHKANPSERGGSW